MVRHVAAEHCADPAAQDLRNALKAGDALDHDCAAVAGVDRPDPPLDLFRAAPVGEHEHAHPGPREPNDVEAAELIVQLEHDAARHRVRGRDECGGATDRSRPRWKSHVVGYIMCPMAARKAQER